MVLYGVEECRSGLSRSDRLESDLSSVVNIFSALDSSIQPQSVRDCYRLGKFSPGASRPRPILVKFVRIADVTRIFSKKINLSTPFSIKPDMSRTQRLQESILMRERWHLIQSGVSRKSIRVRGDSLYVSNKLHGRVSNFKFEHAATDSGASCLTQTSSPRSTSPIVQPIVQHINPSDFPVHNTSTPPPATSPVNNSCLQDTPSGNINISTSATLAAPDQLNTKS